MNYESWQFLQTLRERRDKEYGKLVQKLLALAFLDAGADRVTDRAVQGIDIEVELNGRKLALEVKTAEGGVVSIGKKDLDGLKSRREEGYHAMLAILAGRLTDEWLFLPIPGTDIQATARTHVVMLRPFADSELSKIIEEPFVTAVDRHGVRASDGGQQALNEVLQEDPHYAVA